MRTNRMFKCLSLSIIFCAGLNACIDEPAQGALAPVDNADIAYQARAGVWHDVEDGDNLYSIAFRYDKNPSVIKEQNPGRNLATLQVGQRIFIPVRNEPSQGKTTAKMKHEPANPMAWLANKIRPLPRHAPQTIAKTAYTGGYIWPLRGQILQRFSPYRGQKGIDIAGKQGASVHAVAPGKVVFSGSGIRGYGNLVLIEHRLGMLSAYAYNERVYVGMGQRVSQGQVIAAVGSKTTSQHALHFELRRNGTPVNPLAFLP